MTFYLQWYERLPSTNTFLKERLEIDRELPSGTVVAARDQTQGRGRRDREWLSSTGENLTFSILLRGRYEPVRLPSAAMAAAVAVAEVLEAAGLSPALKWPNDVLVDGKKICGILSEGIPGGVIVGIGLNVNMPGSGHIDQPVTSLFMETGVRREVAALLDQLLKQLSPRLDAWTQGGFSAVRESWELRVPAIWKSVRVRDGNAVRTGILAGFGEAGELLLRGNDGSVSAIWAGDLGMIQDVIQNLLAADSGLFGSRDLIAGCFDAWQDEPAPAKKAMVSVKDYDGMADAALDHLFAALDGEKQACPVALPIAEYQVLNGRF